MDDKGGNAVLVSVTDAHAHEVTALGWWYREVEGKTEVWIISASLDGTLRRWKLVGTYL